MTEESRTTNLGTDEQEPYMRHNYLGKQAHHCYALKNTKKGSYVDTAVIERKKMFLPGEISTTTSWLCREVSRGHSS